MKNEVINRVQGLRLRLGLGQCQMKLKFNRVEHQAQGKDPRLPAHRPVFSLCPPSLVTPIQNLRAESIHPSQRAPLHSQQGPL